MLKFKQLICIYSFLLVFATASAQPPGVPASDPFYKMGYLNVLLIGADNTGTIDCTNEIRKAVAFAQEYKLACYFPSGTYLVSDSISGVLRVTWNGTKWVSDRRKPVYLIGATNPRPVIKLADNATGYDNTSAPKPIFWLWAQNRDGARAGSPDPLTEQSNISMNMVIRNFIFDLNEKPGAVALRFAGAQGSTIEDVKVIANKAFAGFYNCLGQGGGQYNIEVEGGKYAWYIDELGEAKFPVFAGITCRNQETAIFRLGLVNHPMVITGFHFVKQSGLLFTGWPLNGGISLIDGIIDYQDSETVTNAFGTPSNKANLYMRNVYMNNCRNIILNNNLSAIDPANYNLIKDFTYTGLNGGKLIDGVSSLGVSTTLESETATPPDPLSFTTKHTWNPLTFISVEMEGQPDYINVMDVDKMKCPQGTAKGNGSTVDSESLQWAIDNYDKVFMPKGIYMINKPLVLRKNTQLMGAGKTYTVIQPTNTWTTGAEKTMITTVEDKDATTTLSFILLETNLAYTKDLTRVTWKAGKNSIYRDMMIGGYGVTTASSTEHYMLHIKGLTAGGKFYAFATENNTLAELTHHTNYRHVLVDGTIDPIYFYGLNVERIYSGVQTEIRNSSNVEIFYLKSEATTGQSSTPLFINNSNNIALYGLTGKIDLTSGYEWVRLKDSDNILATCMKDFNGASGKAWNAIEEIYNAQTFTIHSQYQVSKFTRNKFVPTSLFVPVQSYWKVIPTNSNLKIIGDVVGNGILKMYNTNGMELQTVKLKNQKEQTIETSGLRNGLYLLAINDNACNQTFKVIINK